MSRPIGRTKTRVDSPKLYFKFIMDQPSFIDDAITYAANLEGLEDYQVEYYCEELSPKDMFLKELLENLEVSLAEPSVISVLDGAAELYETLVDITEPKALLTCKDCLVDLD